MRIRISNKFVGDKYPTFIVAEGGINHDGKIKTAKKLILKAKESNADAIKFQTFTATDLTSIKSKYYKSFKKLELQPHEFAELADYAKSNKIIFLSSPFSNKAVELLSKLKIQAYKIASGDLTNLPMIKFASKKNKPMIISTGMGNLKEIQEVIKTIKSTGNKKIILLHSVSSYPTPVCDVNLKAIQTLKSSFPFPIGYSDNGNDLLVPIIAVSMGAKVIEKHFTLNRKAKGPDHSLSADPKQFKTLVKNIRLVEKMLGNGIKKFQPSEKDNRIHTRRSITAEVTIPKGTKIERSMIGIKRPATGIEPKYFEKLIGKNVTRTIKLDESLKWKDIK